MRDFASKFSGKSGGKGPKTGITDFLDDADEKEVEEAKASGRFVQLSAERFYPDPNQPRKTITKEALDELRQSIEANGQLQPIVVRPADADGRHCIIAGERRWRAISASTLIPEIDAVIRDISSPGESATELELKTLLVQIAENLDREDMLAIEESASVARVVELCKQLGHNRDKACELLRMSTSQITKHLAVMEAPAVIANLSAHGETQDVEVLYNLSKLHKASPEKTTELIDRWRSGDLEGNLRQASQNMLSDEKSSKSGDKEKKGSQSKKPGDSAPVLVKDVDLSIDGDDFVLSFAIKGGKSSKFKLPAELLLKLKQQVNSNWG